MVIRQFDVFRNPNARSSRQVPFLLVLQHDLLEGMPTRVVAPLFREAALPAAARLNPRFRVADTDVVMVTQQLGAVPARGLTRWVANLEARRSEIIGAVDVLVAGV